MEQLISLYKQSVLTALLYFWKTDAILQHEYLNAIKHSFIDEIEVLMEVGSKCRNEIVFFRGLNSSSLMEPQSFRPSCESSATFDWHDAPKGPF